MSTRVAFAVNCLVAATAAVSPAMAQQFVISTYAGGAPLPTPVAAVNASIGYATAVAADTAGNVYFISLNCVFKVDPNGVMTRVAGNARLGYSGDGGPAVSAQLLTTDESEEPSFGFPGGLAVDRLGNLYVTDGGNKRVRKVSAAGIITTIAGNGSPGSSGDGGPANAAQLSDPGALTVDSAGNLYIADGRVVRKVSPDGIITTAAQTGGLGLAVDNAGNLYVASSGAVVRKVSPDGTITTVAGNGTAGYSGDGGPATSAQLNYPLSLALDSTGTLYIGDSDRIRKVSSDGIISTVAGGPSAPIGVDGLAIDSSGNLYAAGYLRVRKVSPNGVVTAFAGDGGPPHYSGDGGPATVAQLNRPFGLALDTAGNLYLADGGNARVRMVSPAGTITTVAGNGAVGYSGDGGPATSAQLSYPMGLVVDSLGNLYIADSGLRIRKVSPDGLISTVAGNGSFGYSGDGGPAIRAQFAIATGLAVDRARNLFILDTENNRVRMVSPDGIITTVAGSGTPGFSGDGGPATSAQLGITSQIHGVNPTGLAIDGAGNLYIADVGNVRVRKVSPSGIITTVAGGARTLGYSGDGGPATAAQMDFPEALAADNTGNLYIAEGGHVRRVSADGIITTIAGNGIGGYSGDGGPAAKAQMAGPHGLASDSRGNVYVADQYNNAVRLVQSISSAIGVSSVTNAASNLSGPIAPGEIVVITGSGLGPTQLIPATPGVDGLYSTELSGTTVQFNGTPAALIYTSTGQVAAQVPDLVSAGTAQVTVTYEGRPSASFPVQVTKYAPGVFTLDSTGKGQAVAINQDGSINTTSRPAQAGDVISLYATGAGDGGVLVTMGGQSAVLSSTKNIAGVVQIGAKIPSGIQTGSVVAVVVQVGNASSQAGVTIAVR